MPTPISLPSRGVRATQITLPLAQDPLSILTALPFLQDPDQAWAVAYQPNCNKTDQDATKLRRDVHDAISASIDGMTVKSGHWSGARADSERSSPHNLDRAFLASGLVRRLTARLPVGPTIESWLEEAESGSPDGQRQCEIANAYGTYLHAKDRAVYQIGEGLLEAAEAMLPFGVLGEAELLYGDGRNRPERLVIRDAMFASEDITIEEMARLLIDAPYQIDEVCGDTPPLWEKDRVATERTPLLFVQCQGIQHTRERNSRHRHSEVILEVVDFQSIEIIEKCISAVRSKHRKIHEDVSNILLDAFDDPLATWRRPNRRTL